MYLPRTIGVLCLVIVTTVACDKEPPIITVPDDPFEQEESITYLYASDETGKFEIWKSEGDTKTQLTSNTDYDNWWPKISPDNQSILFYQSTAGRDINDFTSASLWIMNSTGGEQKQIFPYGYEGWEMQGLANWSNDGERIVMAALDKALGHWQIFTCDHNGENLERISTNDSADYLDPVFARDDASIFCVRIPDGEDPKKENFELYELDVSTKAETRLTFNTFQDHHPDVSPDGTKLVYDSEVDPEYLTIGRWALKELDLQTLQERSLLEDNNLNFLPRYSRDGEFVFFIRLNILGTTTSVSRLQLKDGSVSRLLDNTFNSVNVDPF